MIVACVGAFREVISEAYRSAFDGDCQTVKVKAHEVQSIGTSVLFRKNFVVQQTMRTEKLASRIMFTSFYLRQVSHSSIGMFSIGLWWQLNRSCDFRYVAIILPVILVHFLCCVTLLYFALSHAVNYFLLYFQKCLCPISRGNVAGILLRFSFQGGTYEL